MQKITVFETVDELFKFFNPNRYEREDFPYINDKDVYLVMDYSARSFHLSGKDSALFELSDEVRSHESFDEILKQVFLRAKITVHIT